jgi:hypothetical protein
LKKIRFIISLLTIIIICSSCLAEGKGQKITVQKRVGGDENYVDFNEVTDEKKVRKAMEIVENADWKDVEVEMPRYFDYQFQFPFKSSSEDKIASYLLWVNANDQKLEIVTDSNKYVELTKQNSEILYEILTGEELIK